MEKKIKSIIVSALMLTISTPTFAQAITVSEPEFVNSYYLLTSDSTYAELPKENGTLKKHTSTMAALGKVLKKGAEVAEAAGGVSVMTSNSLEGVVTGMRVMGTAAHVGDAANAITGLTFAEKQDIVFENGCSPYVMNANGDVRIIINNGDNSVDPHDMYRVVRFNVSNKKRKIYWQTITPSLFGTSKAEKIGYANFTGHRYGTQSYVITIPASEAKPGQYGIFPLNIAQGAVIPVATFSIQKNKNK